MATIFDQIRAKENQQKFQRGDVWLIRPEGFFNRGDKKGNVPWLIVQNDAANRNAPNDPDGQIIVAEITKFEDETEKDSETNVFVELGECRLKYESLVNCTNICTVKAKDFVENLGRLSPLKLMPQVDTAIKKHLSLI